MGDLGDAAPGESEACPPCLELWTMAIVESVNETTRTKPPNTFFKKS
jgi:hypothetical protein